MRRLATIALALLVLVLPAAARGDGNFWAQTNGPQGGDAMALATNSNGDVFVGTQGGGVFRSTDNGDSWTLVDTGLTNTYVAALTVSPSGDVYAGTWGGGVFRSTDDGDHWAEANTGLT